ncbi:NAD(P)H-hydrate epimerase [Phycisphaerales bacterium AB-hyl4]|uniref:NAD(P)H-hydrate epimerase n=1 Tax=Natronomicrosphaera hydrolytica TaxID=3242702 RepID=A0ABV4UBP6_9BACT
MDQHTNIGPLTRDQVRELDRLAIESLGIPGIVLMENAAAGAAAELRARLGRRAKAAILCGGGNNAGDGYAMARHLHNHGHGVTLYALKDPAKLTGDAATNHAICQRMGLPIEQLADAGAIEAAADRWAEADAVVDALLGTGFAGEVREPQATAIRLLNAMSGPTVLAVDVPSGLDCQTGEAAEACVRADVTATFVARKTGFDVAEARRWLGEVVVVGIGAPPELVERVRRS